MNLSRSTRPGSQKPLCRGMKKLAQRRGSVPEGVVAENQTVQALNPCPEGWGFMRSHSHGECGF